jgi:hypothetical protein
MTSASDQKCESFTTASRKTYWWSEADKKSNSNLQLDESKSEKSKNEKSTTDDISFRSDVRVVYDSIQKNVLMIGSWQEIQQQLDESKNEKSKTRIQTRNPKTRNLLLMVSASDQMFESFTTSSRKTYWWSEVDEKSNILPPNSSKHPIQHHILQHPLYIHQLDESKNEKSKNEKSKTRIQTRMQRIQTRNPKTRNTTDTNR